MNIKRIAAVLGLAVLVLFGVLSLTGRTVTAAPAAQSRTTTDQVTGTVKHETLSVGFNTSAGDASAASLQISGIGPNSTTVQEVVTHTFSLASRGTNSKVEMFTILPPGFTLVWVSLTECRLAAPPEVRCQFGTLQDGETRVVSLVGWFENTGTFDVWMAAKSKQQQSQVEAHVLTNVTMPPTPTPTPTPGPTPTPAPVVPPRISLNSWFDCGDAQVDVEVVCNFRDGDRWHIVRRANFPNGYTAVDDQWIDINWSADGQFYWIIGWWQLPTGWQLKWMDANMEDHEVDSGNIITSTNIQYCPQIQIDPGQEVTVGTVITLTGSQKNSSGMSWSVGGTLIGSGNPITYRTSEVGAFTVVVTSTSDIGSVTNTTQITVTNTAPIAVAGEDQLVQPGSTVHLDGSLSTDPDGHEIIGYDWQQTGGIPVVLSSEVVSRPTFTGPGSGSVLTFSLIVTDEFGLASTPDEVIVKVNFLTYLVSIAKNARTFCPPPTVEVSPHSGMPNWYWAEIRSNCNITEWGWLYPSHDLPPVQYAVGPADRWKPYPGGWGEVGEITPYGFIWVDFQVDPNSAGVEFKFIHSNSGGVVVPPEEGDWDWIQFGWKPEPPVD